MRIRRYVWFFFLGISGPLFSQDYSVKHYRVENGLPTDIVRTIAQDTIGYYWIGTDDGLIKFDGSQFTTYPNATPSASIKSIYTCDDGKIFALSDLGLTQIVNLVDTVYFDTKIEGSMIPEQDKLWSPKSVFEDQQQRFWFGEPQAIMRYYKGDMYRYELPAKYASPSSNRSFTFEESTTGEIYAGSVTGNLLHLEPTTNRFDEVKLPMKVDEINDLQFVNDHLFLATYQGLFRLQLESHRVIDFQQIGDLEEVSSLKVLENVLLATSFRSVGNYVRNPNDADPVIFPFDSGLPGANEIFVNDQNEIWLSTDKGSVMLQERPFTKVANDEYTFVNAVIASGNKVIVAERNRLLTYVITEGQVRKLDVILEGRTYDFTSLAIDEEGVWVSEKGKVLLIKDGTVAKKWDFDQDGQFIKDLLADNGTVWVAQEGNPKLRRIKEDGEIASYDLGLIEGVNVVRSNQGHLLVGANRPDSYLFHYMPDADYFENISLPLPFEPTGIFKVNDLVLCGDAIWLATTDGLLKQKGGVVTRIDLGDRFENLNVRSVKKENDSTLWLSNPYGLIKYNAKAQEYTLFDESSGLPSNHIGPRGIFLDRANRVWAGTASGLAYAPMDAHALMASAQPLINQVTVNGEPVKFYNTQSVTFPTDATVGVSYASVSFPHSSIQYSYRLDDGPWSKPMSVREIRINDLEPGKHLFELRAKNTGRPAWSTPTSLVLHSEVVFIQSPLARVLFVLLIGIVVFSTYKVTRFVLRRRQQTLEKLISERTAELEKANRTLESKNAELVQAEEMLQKQFNELEHTNKELDQFVYSASHDLSAPLKSLSGLVFIAKHDAQDGKQTGILEMMQDSITKLERFIKDVINYSRNSRTSVAYTSIHLNTLVCEIIEDLRLSGTRKEIRFNVDIPKQTTILSDLTRLKIVLNNLISNAIKFQKEDEAVQPCVDIAFSASDSSYLLTVSDNGIGIPKDYTGKVFDMFYRANQDSNGSGLGLYILKETVEKLGGSVRVESTEGEGTSFYVELPVHAEYMKESIEVPVSNNQG